MDGSHPGVAAVDGSEMGEGRERDGIYLFWLSAAAALKKETLLSLKTRLSMTS